MEKIEQLRSSLQAQRARLDRETREREEELHRAYAAVGELNFLGFSPKQLAEANIPSSFMRGAYQHCKLPVTEPAEHVEPNPQPMLAVDRQKVKENTIQAASKQQPSSKHARKRAKGAPNWDSEWVAPVREKFGDDRWSQSMSIDLSDSDEDEDESELLATIDTLKIQVKMMRNHVKQTTQALEVQKRRVEEKTRLLHERENEFNDAVERLHRHEKRKYLPHRPSLKHAHPEPVEPAVAPMEIVDIDEVSVPEVIDIDDMSAEPEAEPVKELLQTEPKAEAEELKVPEEIEEIEVPEVEVPENKVPEIDVPEEQKPEEHQEKQEQHEKTEPKISEQKPEPAPPAPPKLPPPPAPSVVHPFTPLPGPASPLAMFNRYRIKPLWMQSDAHRVLSRTFNSPFTQIADRFICEDEASGKECGGCDDVHFKDFDATPTEVLRQILVNYVPAETRKTFKARLKQQTSPSVEDTLELLLACLR